MQYKAAVAQQHKGVLLNPTMHWRGICGGKLLSHSAVQAAIALAVNTTLPTQDLVEGGLLGHLALHLMHAS
jgi:hypothetical protein